MKPSQKSKTRLNVESALLCVMIGLFLCGVVMLPDCARAEPATTEEEPPKDDGVARCPYTTMTDQEQCLNCHAEGRDFKRIKETSPHDLFDYPPNLKIHQDDQGRYGLFNLEGAIGDYTPSMLERAFRYLRRHDVNRMVIDIDSPGGSVFAGWKTKEVIDYYQKNGFDVVTQVRSIAASAAFTIFCAADTRLISPTAELMQHELWTFSFLSLDTPSDSEHKAKILRHIQETITVWLASRAGMTKEELSDKIKKKEYWLNGAQAKRMNWATGYTTPVDPELEQALLEQVEQF